MKKAFIKGTNIVVDGRFLEHDGALMWIDKNLIEERQVFRDEPPEGSLEKDHSGDLWFHFENGWSFLSAFKTAVSSAETIEIYTWAEMQQQYGPTTPMKLVDDD